MSTSRPQRTRGATMLGGLALAGLGCALFLPLAAAAVPSSAVLSDGGADEVDARGFTWDRRAVEHVWNRAGFGIRSVDVDHWVVAGPEALIDYLLAPRPFAGQEPAVRFVYDGIHVDPVEYRNAPIARRRELSKARNRSYREQFIAFRSAWVQRLIDGEDPLRDRMTLFWHGVFTSSLQTVKHPAAIIGQHDTLRDGALGSYEALLRAMLRDPAMLVYLNNDQNRKGKPNENLAREVMELFSLGEGNYTEEDVRQAARALTGAGVNKRVQGGAYRFERRQHDSGDKIILGVSGDHGPQDLATILIDQPACATFIAGSIIEYLEGVPADEARVARYAAGLRETGYDVGYMLRKLLLDPEFYRDDVIGARVSSPVDYLVGTVTRLDLDVPPEFVPDAAASLGQDMFRPPSVKGWDEGYAWISTSSFMMRGNVAGAMLGVVDTESMRADALNLVRDLAETGEMEGMSRQEMRTMGREQLRRDEVARLAGMLKRADYEPNAYLTRLLMHEGTKTDEAAVLVLTDALLAIEPPREAVQMLTGRLRDLRETYEIDEKELALSRQRSERVLRQLGHLILSLPEAQLH